MIKAKVMILLFLVVNTGYVFTITERILTQHSKEEEKESCYSKEKFESCLRDHDKEFTEVIGASISNLAPLVIFAECLLGGFDKYYKEYLSYCISSLCLYLYTISPEIGIKCMAHQISNDLAEWVKSCNAEAEKC